MEWIVEFLQKNPIIAIFLTLGLGFQLGKLRIKSFSLGPVAATLVVGVIIGQLKITVPDMLKTVFFLFFLFSIGYSVGPQFFRSLKGPGARMALFSVIAAAVCAGLVIGAAHLMGYSKGIAAGLFAGSQTVSASLGLLSDTIKEMPMGDDERSELLMLIPACYAVTYVFGTIGTAWFLSSVGPRMMGGLEKVKAETAKIEQEMETGNTSQQPGMIPARRAVLFRAYKTDSEFFDSPQSVGAIQKMYADKGIRVLVERARTTGGIIDPTETTIIRKGDTIVLGGRAADIICLTPAPGPEETDSELLNFGAERTPVTVASGRIDGMTLGTLRNEPYMERVVVASIKRDGRTIPVGEKTELHAGDVLTIVGWPRDVEEAANHIGYADRQTNSTDMVFVGLGIALGCIVGALSIKINGIPLALGTSVGALASGLWLGWLRARKPSFGHIPQSVVWLFNNLGVNMFIAILGLTAGGALMKGLHEAGVLIIAVGAILTILSVVINLMIARRIFGFSRPVTLGCVAGARCCVAAIGAVQDTLQSSVPNLGYTVTYAVANVTLVFSSLAVLFLC